jgi:hypothetical protein
VLSPVADGISGPLDPLGHDFPDFVCLLRWELEPFVLWCLCFCEGIGAIVKFNTAARPMANASPSRENKGSQEKRHARVTFCSAAAARFRRRIPRQSISGDKTSSRALGLLACRRPRQHLASQFRSGRSSRSPGTCRTPDCGEGVQGPGSRCQGPSLHSTSPLSWMWPVCWE